MDGQNCVQARNPNSLSQNINDLLQDAANLCTCNSFCKPHVYSKSRHSSKRNEKCEPFCLTKDPNPCAINIKNFCQLIRDYNAPSGVAQCIQAKLTNPCYGLSTEFQKILDQEFDQRIDTWNYIYTTCYECNGCSDKNCIYTSYNLEPIPIDAVPSGNVGGVASSRTGQVLYGANVLAQRVRG